MNLPPPPPPQNDNPIIAQFKPVDGQWELNDDNLKRIDPETGQTILHNYCEYINTTPIEIYEHLIETKGCDINAQDNNKDTPIHRAICHFSPTQDGGNVAVLTYLLGQKNVNVNIKGEYGATLVHAACIWINKLPLDVFKSLIEAMGSDVTAIATFNNTLLPNALFYFDAKWGGKIGLLNYLFSQKIVNVNIKDKDGFTLLHVACKYINKLPLDVFKLLIETYGADVNTQDNSKDTPLHVALNFFRQENGGDIAVLTYLLAQKDVNVNITGKKGCHLLHLTCINNLSSMCSAELKSKIDAFLGQIAGMIAERYIQQVLNEMSS